MFWWRDDDAVRATQALDRLLLTRSAWNVPLGLAVIPVQVDRSLERALSSEAPISVLQHGWDHFDHSHGRPSAELAEHRRLDEVEAQLTAGREALENLFGHRFMRVLVPPFNYLGRRLSPAVSRAGLRWVSLASDFPDTLLAHRDVHVDLIDWRRRTAAHPAELVTCCIVALRLRRYGIVPKRMPIGIMTHHLDHDAEIWARLDDLLSILCAHQAPAFVRCEDMFVE